MTSTFKEQTLLEAILATVPEIIAEVDANKVYTWMNRAGIDFFGEDAIGSEAALYFVGEQNIYETVQPIFDRGNEETFYVESLQRRRDGESRLLAWWCCVLKDESGKVTGALSTACDITERSQAEEERSKLQTQLLQAQKMESIGVLAGGVAHEINNPINIVSNYAELILDEVNPDSAVAKNIGMIVEATDRVAAIVKNLLAFSREEKERHSPA